MEKFINLKEMCHSYAAHDGSQIVALDHINLSIDRGEFVAIIGTNGSGKSTLAKHLNALLVPSSGQCLIDGLDTMDHNNIWDVRHRVGMVFQNPDNQIVATVVEEDVAFGPENLGIAPKEIQQRVDEALKIVGMGEYRYHSPHLLSGGQKQRVAIAGVLAMQSNCLVLDEPTAMLDPKGRQEVLSTVCQLHKERNITVVYITHFMEEAVQGDRIVVMEEGKIIIDDVPKVVFKEVDLLHSIGLDVPQVTELAYELQKEGVDIESGILNIEEMVEAICQL